MARLTAAVLLVLGLAAAAAAFSLAALVRACGGAAGWDASGGGLTATRANLQVAVGALIAIVPDAEVGAASSAAAAADAGLQDCCLRAACFVVAMVTASLTEAGLLVLGLAVAAAAAASAASVRACCWAAGGEDSCHRAARFVVMMVTTRLTVVWLLVLGLAMAAAAASSAASVRACCGAAGRKVRGAERACLASALCFAVWRLRLLSWRGVVRGGVSGVFVRGVSLGAWALGGAASLAGLARVLCLCWRLVSGWLGGLWVGGAFVRACPLSDVAL